MIDSLVRVVHFTLSNLMVVSFLGAMLVILPVMGIVAIHDHEDNKRR